MEGRSEPHAEQAAATGEPCARPRDTSRRAPSGVTGLARRQRGLRAGPGVDFLTGARREPRLRAVTLALASELLVLGRLAPDLAGAEAAVERVLASGAAAERFARMVVALGGPADIVERPQRHLASAPVQCAVTPLRPGTVTGVDARALGLLLVELGGGRRRADDTIDTAVGLAGVRGVGDAVADDRPLAVLHARTAAAAEAGAGALRRAMTVGEAATAPDGPLLGRMCSDARRA